MTERYLHAIFCDDIREEVGNKQSLIGVYSGDMIVPKLPAVLPKLCAHITIVSPVERPITRIRIYAKLNDVVLVDTGPKDLPAPPRVDGAKRFELTAGFAVAPAAIDSDSVFQVYAETETEGEELKSRKLEIRAASEPVVQQDAQREEVAVGN